MKKESKIKLIEATQSKSEKIASRSEAHAKCMRNGSRCASFHFEPENILNQNRVHPS
jgi:hypothetical protein